MTMADFTRAVLPWLVAPPFYRQASQVEGLIQFAERNPWPQDSEAFARQARRPSRTTRALDSAQISTPMLVLSGELDLLNPPRVAAELAERFAEREAGGLAGRRTHAARRGSDGFPEGDRAVPGTNDA